MGDATIPIEHGQGLGHRERPQPVGIEHGNPRYILDLLEKVVHVSVRTVQITEQLPSIDTEGKR